VVVISVSVEILHSCLDFIFPPACPVCGGTHDPHRLICPGCIEAIAEQAHGYNPSGRHLSDIDHISVLLPYDGTCRALVHALKYHGMKSLGPILGGFMAEKTLKAGTLPGEAWVVPVPLHPSKLNDRGYNQSERLAAGFSVHSGLPVHTDLVARTRRTETQTALGQEDRVRNVSDAFRYTGPRPLGGRPVIIIDDVMTTGSTLSECARVLRNGGAGSIWACVVATPDPGSD